MNEMTPFTLAWWLKMHGLAFSTAQWWKSHMKDMTNASRYIKLAVYIECRILRMAKLPEKPLKN